MPSLRLRPSPVSATLPLAAAIGLLAGCESSGSPDAGAARSATLTPTDQPADAGAAAELRLLSQTAAAPILTREHLVGSVIAWRKTRETATLEGGFAAWAAQARAGRWLPDAVLAEPTKPVRAGEAARALASLLDTSDSAAGTETGSTSEADSIAALREAGVIQRAVTTGDPISGERWLAWLGAAKDLRATSALAVGPSIATRPVPIKPTALGEVPEPRPTPRPAPTTTAAATPPKGESFDDFDSTPAPPPPPPPTSGRADSSPSRPPSTPPSTRAAARTQTADQPTIPSARPEPLPARLDEVAEPVGRRPGSPAAPADRRRAWTPGRPVLQNQPAPPPQARRPRARSTAMNAPLGPIRGLSSRRATPLALASLVAMLASGPTLAQAKPSTQPATPAKSPPAQPPAGKRAEPAPPAAAPATPSAKPPAPAAKATPSPTGLVRIEPARIEIRAAEGAAELRRVWPDSGQTGAWRRAASEPPASLAADYRTGMNGRVTLRVSGDTLLTIDRLTEARVALARVAPAADETTRTGDAASAPAGAPGSATRVVVDLKRGRVRVVPPAGGAVNVVTPEGLTVIGEEAVVSHDAETGTRVRLAAKTPDTPRPTAPKAPSAPASG